MANKRRYYYITIRFAKLCNKPCLISWYTTRTVRRIVPQCCHLVVGFPFPGSLYTARQPHCLLEPQPLCREIRSSTPESVVHSLHRPRASRDFGRTGRGNSPKTDCSSDSFGDDQPSAAKQTRGCLLHESLQSWGYRPVVIQGHGNDLENQSRRGRPSESPDGDLLCLATLPSCYQLLVFSPCYKHE